MLKFLVVVQKRKMQISNKKKKKRKSKMHANICMHAVCIISKITEHYTWLARRLQTNFIAHTRVQTNFNT